MGKQKMRIGMGLLETGPGSPYGTREVEKRKGLDNGVIDKPDPTNIGGFARFVADGENPKGFIAQTVNGTSRQDHKANNQAWTDDNDRWTNNNKWNGDRSGE